MLGHNNSQDYRTDNVLVFYCDLLGIVPEESNMGLSFMCKKTIDTKTQKQEAAEFLGEE